ncbi:ComEC/Rec2 family competence protein [Nocardioides cynanchi]|uniref:ComEC/Rec2 family competence protein n=1 Tax=Nocardioides cynanchi TaxID=2558918 RepID=UPI001EE1B8AE|nr:ComEC/Rec2 family competence protein [Nocardioides cynanchi]
MRPEVPDLRMPALAAAAWSGALLARASGPGWPALAALLGCGATVVAWRRRGRLAGLTVLAALLVAGAAATSAGVRAARVADNPLAALGRADASVTVVGSVVDDPRLIQGRFAQEVLVRLEVTRVRQGGTTLTLREPLLVFGARSWMGAPLGATVGVSGRLSSSTGGDVAAVLSTSDGPDIRAGPDPWWRASDRIRQALRDSTARLPPDRRVLVPALVDGDDAGLDPALVDDFRTTGLTHLLAVSGTNLTLVVGFVLVVARWLRVRGRWLYVVGAGGIVGFVLLARAEPSVLRAAAMGTVALVGLGSNGRDRGTRALSVATVALLLVDPGLASSVGFALSVLATAGILLLAPGWRDALGSWLPRWLAEAIAVPAAAQLMCTPLIAAISGQVSLVAVAANLLAAPAVGPATVLGLIGGVLTLAWPAPGRLVAGVAGWFVGWIVVVARHGAALPTAAIGWGSGPVALTVLTGLSVGVALGAPHLIRRRTTGVACAAVLVLAVLVRLPTPGWPPDGWVMVMCDVGQGDGLVLNTGVAGTAVVVDAGPDPRLMDRCLTGLGIRRIPLVVLTHFHADHVDGLPGVLSGRRVDAIEVTRLADPPEGVALVRRAAAAAGLTPTVAPYARTRRIGDLELEPLWPLPDSPTVGPGDGSTANNASVVMLARVRGVTILLGGDVEPEGQATLATMLPGLRVDVLKVPHHGSRYQDLPFLQSLRARLALISVGADNDYGHPAAATVAGLAATGERVLRTDLDGSIAVVEHDGRLAAVTGG